MSNIYPSFEYINTLVFNSDLWSGERLDSVTITPNGKYVIAQGDYSLKIWDLLSGKVIHQFYFNEDISDLLSSIVISPDGKVLIAHGLIRIKAWDLESFQEIYTLRCKYGCYFGHIIMGRDGNAMVSAVYSLVRGVEAETKVWDIYTGQEINTFEYLNGAKALLPDGKTIVYGDIDHSIQIWDVITGQKIHTFVGHSCWINALAISSDGRILVSGGRDRMIKVWNLQTNKEILTLKEDADSIEHLKFIDNSNKFISRNKEYLKIWDFSANTLLFTIHEPGLETINFAISTDTETLATVSVDYQIKVWDLHTHSIIYTLTGNSEYIKAIAISLDKKIIAAGCTDKKVRIWKIN